MWTSRGGRSQGEGRQVSILSNPVSPFPKGSHVHSTSYTRASMQGYNRTTGLCSSRGSPGWQQRGAWWTSTHGPAVKQPCQLSFIALGLENARPSWQPINTSMSDALASTCTRCPQNDCQRWGSCYCCVLTAMLDSRGRMYVNVTTLAPKEIVHPKKKTKRWKTWFSFFRGTQRRCLYLNVQLLFSIQWKCNFSLFPTYKPSSEILLNKLFSIVTHF